MSYIHNNKINIEEIIEKANLGDAESQYTLGRAYCSGRYVERDYSAAVRWFEKSAEQGNEDAMIFLGTCYIQGYGVEKNVWEGIKLWTMAADRDNKQAMIKLASLHYNGSYSFDVNYNEAFKWYIKADCKSRIGECYLYGRGVEQDYKMAVKYFIEADDRDMLGECYLHGWGVEKNVKKTVELWESISEHTNHTINDKLWHLYLDGNFIDPDYEKAFRLLNNEAFREDGDPEGGDYEARYELARCYYEGKGVKKDTKLALKLYRSTIELFYRYDGSASISEEPDCILNTRRILVKHGYKSEINKIKKAAEAGDAKAAEILEEAGIEFIAPQQSTPISTELTVEPILKAAPKREAPIDIAVGETVIHKIFGEGIVRKSENGYIIVAFACGEKKFLNPEAFYNGFFSRDV